MRRFWSPRPTRFLASVALAAIVVAGCAPQQPGQTTTGGQAPGPTQQPAAAQELRYPIETVRTLDPSLATDNVSIDVITKIFDGLVDLTDDGKIAPQIAEKWEVSTDATKFTFTLRSNAKWSDGKQITADDFVFAFQRVLDPKTGSEYAKTIEVIKGGDKALKGEAPPTSISAKAVNPTTLEVETREPAAYFLALMSTWTAMPIRKDLLDKFGDKWINQGNIQTTGPFKLQEWVPDQRFVLVRNEEYWGQKPALTKITMRVFPDGPDQEGQILRAYEAGELDVTGKRDVPPSEVDRVMRDPVLSKEVAIFDQSRTTWVCVNNIKAPFSDVRVRKAMGMSLERDRLINQVLKQPLKPAEGVVPPGILGRQPNAWPKENLAEAKSLLAQAGYPDGRGFPEFTYLYNSSAANKAIAEYLQARWKEALGITMKLEAMDFPVLIPLRRGNKTYDSFRCSWGSDFEDPVNWYNTLFDSTADQTQQTTNWKNDRFDQLVRQAASERDPAKRQQMYEEADRLMAQDYFTIPVFFGAQRVLVKPYVKNYKVSRIAEGAALRQVSIQR